MQRLPNEGPKQTQWKEKRSLPARSAEVLPELDQQLSRLEVFCVHTRNKWVRLAKQDVVFEVKGEDIHAYVGESAPVELQHRVQHGHHSQVLF